MNNLDKVFKALADFLDDNKEMDIPYLIKGKNCYTKRELVNELKGGTETGQMLVNDMVLLALDLTARAKEKSKNFSTPEL